MTTFTKTGNFLCFQHFNISFRAYTLYDVTKIEVIDSYKEGKDRIRLILDKEVMCSEPYDRNLSPDYMKFLTHCVAFPDLIQDLDNGTYYLEEDKLKKSSKKIF